MALNKNMAFCLFVLIFTYSWVVLRRLVAWLRLKPVKVPPDYLPFTSVTVIVAIRNEENQINGLLQDLKTQHYPPHLLEVIIVDDYSEDNSAGIIKNFLREVPFKMQVIQLAKVGGNPGKKGAVAAGVAAATGELLVFTDGDCRVPTNWLLNMAYMYTTFKAKFISGPVFYHKPQNLFGHLQLVEFASLIGTGGSSIALGKPNMCNGANLAYPKTIFEEAGGFSGNDHIPSGDDEFLMHKVQRLYPKGILFLKALEATVYTAPKPDLAGFLAQRIRWSSKWPAYHNVGVKVLAVLVFGVNLGLFVAAILAALGYFWVKFLLWAILFKILVDIIFLSPILSFFKKKKYLLLVAPLQLIYIPYVVLTALVGLKGNYTWKGREIKK